MLPGKKAALFLFISLFFSFYVFTQGRGAIFDEQYDNLPRRAELSWLSYEGLPSSFSLKLYAPLPGHQENYGTCVAWAVAYAARTISESIALNRINQTETTRSAFSPVFSYRYANPHDLECIRGMQIYTALDYMKDIGTVRRLEIEESISFSRINLAYYRTVKKYPITDYVTLFSRDTRQKPALLTRIVKKSITEGKPVIVGLNAPDSFDVATEVWQPWENPNWFYYGHAVCVIGYDDNKYGGAFEILNSWGRKWGNGGYIWIPYQVFADFATEGYEIIENIASLSGSLKFDGFMKVDVVNPQSSDVTSADVTSANETCTLSTASLSLNQFGYYTTIKNFTEGTKVSLTVGTRESAYVYTFKVSRPQGQENFYSPVLLFPQAGFSPLLNYSYSAVALPGEDRTIDLDTQGTTYIITLYSKYPMEINNIIRTFSSVPGSVRKRLSAAIGDGYTTMLDFNENEAAFTLLPENANAVAALVVAIRHY